MIGVGMIINEGVKWAVDKNPSENKAEAWYWVTLSGGLILWTRIQVWLVGANKKKKNTPELAKFNPPGSASINGIGIKVSF
jgi:hypothetical protein